MEQAPLFAAADTTVDAALPPLDPEKYRADRAECQYPHLQPSTAYGYRCRCKGCVKYHSAERHRRKAGPLPCNYEGCTNPRRRVQAAKYCDEHATSRDYQPLKPYVLPVPCASCGEVKPIHRDKRYRICASCHDANTSLIQQATTHHVPLETLVAMMRDPRCELCGKAVYTGRGSARAGFALDHDHTCCVGSRSCGTCVRGLLCNSCNLSLGHVESMISKASLPGLMRYLGLSF